MPKESEDSDIPIWEFIHHIQGISGEERALRRYCLERLRKIQELHKKLRNFIAEFKARNSRYNCNGAGTHNSNTRRDATCLERNPNGDPLSSNQNVNTSVIGNNERASVPQEHSSSRPLTQHHTVSNVDLDGQAEALQMFLEEYHMDINRREISARPRDFDEREMRNPSCNFNDVGTHNSNTGKDATDLERNSDRDSLSGNQNVNTSDIGNNERASVPHERSSSRPLTQHHTVGNADLDGQAEALQMILEEYHMDINRREINTGKDVTDLERNSDRDSLSSNQNVNTSDIGNNERAYVPQERCFSRPLTRDHSVGNIAGVNVEVEDWLRLLEGYCRNINNREMSTRPRDFNEREMRDPSCNYNGVGTHNSNIGKDATDLERNSGRYSLSSNQNVNASDIGNNESASVPQERCSSQPLTRHHCVGNIEGVNVEVEAWLRLLEGYRRSFNRREMSAWSREFNEEETRDPRCNNDAGTQNSSGLERNADRNNSSTNQNVNRPIVLNEGASGLQNRSSSRPLNRNVFPGNVLPERVCLVSPRVSSNVASGHSTRIIPQTPDVSAQTESRSQPQQSSDPVGRTSVVGSSTNPEIRDVAPPPPPPPSPSPSQDAQYRPRILLMSARLSSPMRSQTNQHSSAEVRSLAPAQLMLPPSPPHAQYNIRPNLSTHTTHFPEMRSTNPHSSTEIRVAAPSSRYSKYREKKFCWPKPEGQRLQEESPSSSCGRSIPSRRFGHSRNSTDTSMQSKTPQQLGRGACLTSSAYSQNAADNSTQTGNAFSAQGNISSLSVWHRTVPSELDPDRDLPLNSENASRILWIKQEPPDEDSEPPETKPDVSSLKVEDEDGDSDEDSDDDSEEDSDDDDDDDDDDDEDEEIEDQIMEGEEDEEEEDEDDDEDDDEEEEEEDEEAKDIDSVLLESYFAPLWASGDEPEFINSEWWSQLWKKKFEEEENERNQGSFDLNVPGTSASGANLGFLRRPHSKNNGSAATGSGKAKKGVKRKRSRSGKKGHSRSKRSKTHKRKDDA